MAGSQQEQQFDELSKMGQPEGQRIEQIRLMDWGEH